MSRNSRPRSRSRDRWQRDGRDPHAKGGHGGHGTRAASERRDRRRDSRRRDERPRSERQYRDCNGHRPNGTDHRRQDSRSRSRRGQKKEEKRPPSSSSASSDATNDDEIIHFDWEPGRTIGDRKHRYLMKEVFGDGTFGRCLRCTDENDPDRKIVAIKVIRDIERYVENARIEVEVLEAIAKHDPRNESYCVHLLHTFFHQQFFCLVFEPAAHSLYDLIKKNNYRGMWMEDIQVVGEQLLKALKFCHGIRLTHTDLKPENILFQRERLDLTHLPRSGARSEYWRPRCADIKVIDFGNATFADDHHASIINTRQYRSPEVIFGMSWNESSDQWSVGCILMEIYQGELFFATHENMEHLALVEKTLGPLPQKFLDRAPRIAREKWVHRNGHRLAWPENAVDNQSVRAVQHQRTLKEHVHPRHMPLADLVEELLRYDPSTRPEAGEALRHRLFREKLEE